MKQRELCSRFEDCIIQIAYNRFNARVQLAPSMHITSPSEKDAFSQKIKSHIKQTMVRAKRRGSWFSLDRKEKSILYLSVRLQLKFESLQLLRSLASILKKLEERGETLHAWVQRGMKLAWAFSEFAVSCGNEAARSWRNDRSYAAFLGKMQPSSGLGRS
jgi:hypothetical protein